MESLIIGYGSIGQRHAKCLSELKQRVSLVTSKNEREYPSFKSIAEAFSHQHFDLIIVANPTHLHHPTLVQLAEHNYNGLILIEKPLFAKAEATNHNLAAKIFVAYNLRFSELLLTAKERIDQEELVSFSACVGQYLPTWRKGQDYRDSYSAKKTEGGGVLRDLSHELDYSLWLCGPCYDLCAFGGQFSELELNTEDVYSIIMRCQRCPLVTLHLNYLDRTPRREISIQTKQHTYFIDLINGVLRVDGELHFQTKNDVEQSYYKQHQALLEGNYGQFCSYQQGIDVVKLIETIERSSLLKCWMQL